MLHFLVWIYLSRWHLPYIRFNCRNMLERDMHWSQLQSFSLIIWPDTWTRGTSRFCQFEISFMWWPLYLLLCYTNRWIFFSKSVKCQCQWHKSNVTSLLLLLHGLGSFCNFCVREIKNFSHFEVQQQVEKVFTLLPFYKGRTNSTEGLQSFASSISECAW